MPFLNCDECKASWYSVALIHSGSSFSGYKVKSHLASKKEIEYFGWNNFALNLYQK